MWLKIPVALKMLTNRLVSAAIASTFGFGPVSRAPEPAMMALTTACCFVAPLALESSAAWTPAATAGTYSSVSVVMA